MIDTSVATVTLTSLSPMTHSRQHDAPRLEKESPDDYDRRTWREKLHVEDRNGKRTVVIPAMALHQAIAAAAKYSKKQIVGQGKATWTAKFASGIMIPENPALNIDPETLQNVTISANADGVRGSGKRVTRRFPVIPAWTTTFEVYILDTIITEEIFTEMVEIAGMFIGIGQYRPQNWGTNGRFKVSRIVWQDNRRFAA